MTTRWRRYRGRLEVEIVLALVVGVAAFVIAALVSASARSRVPTLLLGLCFVGVVLAVARFGGLVYAIPVGLVSLYAFDWYFLPPLRDLDSATVFVLGVSIITAVLVAEIASHAGRRAESSEEARGLLADEQAALQRVATLVARGLPPTDVFAAVAEEVGRLVSISGTRIIRYESDGTATVVAAWAETVEPSVLQIGARLTLEGESVTALVSRTGRPARMDQYTSPTGSIATLLAEARIRAAVGAPIVVEGRLWGVMIAGSIQLEPLPEGTESRLAQFTELVAMAIANAEARRELERVAAEQASVNRIATLVAEAGPSTEIFAAVAAEIAELFELPLAALFRFGPDRTATVIAASGDLSPAVRQSWSFPLDDPGVLASLLRTGRPARIDDYAEVAGAGADAAREIGIGSAVGVPIIADGRIWGAVTVGHAQGCPPLPADAVDHVTAFTDLVATGIANAIARTEIEQLAEEQAALRRVATLVARGVPPDEVFAAVGEEIRRVLRVTTTCVLRFESDASATVVASGGDARLSPVGSTWTLEGESVIARVFRARRSARRDSYDEAPGEIAALARRLGTRSAVGAPIIIEDRLWGAAVAESTDPLPDVAERRMASFADLIATAISNAETRSELTASRARVVAASDETRRQIERNLHDGTQQRLVSLGIALRAAEADVPPGLDELRAKLSHTASGLAAAVEDLQEIARGIHPAILSKGGLVPALETLAGRAAVPVQLAARIDRALPEPVEVAAYYVVSEALTNAAKHAHASVVQVELAAENSIVELAIRDDGVGGADPARGSGLVGLRDRVEALGGTIEIASRPGLGTSLKARIPTARIDVAPEVREYA